MPMYEYVCTACGHADTLIEKLNASKSKKCPACNKARAFARQLSAPAFHLKGSGWYATDFRENKAKAPAKQASDAGETSKTEKDQPAAAKKTTDKDTATTAAT